MNDDLPEVCRRAGVDDDADVAPADSVSVEVDATGPFAVTPEQAEALSVAFRLPPLVGADV
jgi:hypothetical protein